MSTEEMTSDELDALLSASAPATTELTEVGRTDLGCLVRSSRVELTDRPRRRRRRVVGIATVGLVVGAGSMVAAAGSGLDWVPWASSADRSETFATPRGQSCEAIFRLHNDQGLRASNPAVHAELVAFLAGFEPSPEAIEAESRLMADAEMILDETGETTTGTALFNADDLERMARERVVGHALQVEADSLGVAGMVDLEGVSECDE